MTSNAELIERARCILQSDLGLLTDAFDRLDADQQNEVVERLAEATASTITALEERITVLSEALENVRKREADVADDEHLAPGIRNYSSRSVEIIDAVRGK